MNRETLKEIEQFERDHDRYCDNAHTCCYFNEGRHHLRTLLAEVTSAPPCTECGNKNFHAYACKNNPRNLRKA